MAEADTPLVKGVSQAKTTKRSYRHNDEPMGIPD
jgi:hypothetical protein